MLCFLFPILSCSNSKAQKPQTVTKQNKKRPYGYWKSASNLSAELRAFADQSDEKWRMPTQAELLAGGRSDIAGAVRRQGTWKSAADNAGLVLTSIARPRSLYLTFCTDITSPRMRPYMYWRNFENLRNELLEFVDAGNRTKGTGAVGWSAGYLPSAAQLETARRSDLIRAIRIHGGFERVARLLDFRARYHSRAYWAEFRNVENDLRQFIAEFGEDGVMPPVALLRKYAPPGLFSAIEKVHGGSTAVAKRMGLRCVHPRRRSGYWKSRENRITELKAFLQEYRRVKPDRDHTLMPSHVQMIRMGRSDLVRALCRYEGFSNMAVLVGLRPYGKAGRALMAAAARREKREQKVEEAAEEVCGD